MGGENATYRFPTLKSTVEIGADNVTDLHSDRRRPALLPGVAEPDPPQLLLRPGDAAALKNDTFYWKFGDFSYEISNKIAVFDTGRTASSRCGPW